jgi:hypothetical protein
MGRKVEGRRVRSRLHCRHTFRSKDRDRDRTVSGTAYRTIQGCSKNLQIRAEMIDSTAPELASAAVPESGVIGKAADAKLDGCFGKLARRCGASATFDALSRNLDALP